MQPLLTQQIRDVRRQNCSLTQPVSKALHVQRDEFFTALIGHGVIAAYDFVDRQILPPGTRTDTDLEESSIPAADAAEADFGTSLAGEEGQDL